MPEVYLEAILELFTALTKIESNFASISNLEERGLQNFITLIIENLSHNIVINPGIKESVLLVLNAFFSDQVLLTH